MNHLSVASAYSIYKYNNKLWLKYDSTNSTIIDQDISTTSTTFTNTYTTTNGLYLNHGTSGSSHIRIYDNDSTIITGSGSIKATFYPHTSYGMFFYTYGINVGTLSVGAMPYHLTCVGTQGSSTSTLWTSISDRRSKINVELLNDNILDEFMKINFYKFNHIYDKNKIKFGCIADEICNCCVFGDCVKAHDKICIEDVDTKEKYEIENCKDFNPEKIMFASFKVIQIQEKRIKALEDENIRLKTVIDNILTRLTNIEEDLTV
jgi:hypothetical protein